MANEFKIKKGLIVTGASGGTVVDIQGSQGQLFSVTDDLSGSIFAVSDISGVPILDVNSSGLSTFDGNLSISEFIYHTGDIGTSIKMIPGQMVLKNSGGKYINLHSNGIMYFDASAYQFYSGNATFAGSVVTPTIITDNVVAKTTSGNITFKNNGGATIAQFANDKSATFQDQVFATVATSSGDGSSTLTTKGYVDGLITGATIYRGAWDPSGGGYGSPDLSGVTQTSGYYYICSADGTATPNGPGTEPNTWAVGDWCIYNDVSGTGAWQKIDNSSVLSGVGTGQTVALWEGAGSVTDSETLGNAPITVSGNNTTFAGTITGQNIYGNQFVDAQDNAYYANPAMTSVMKGASFDGDVTVTTQAIGDDSTLVATTEYADRAAGAVPIGNYLPLSAGSGSPLTDTLYGTSTNFSGNGGYAGSMTLGTGASTAEVHLTIGQGRTDSGFSYIDLVGGTTYPDYGLRIIRGNTGANTGGGIYHRGTGNLEIQATDSASILLRTNNTTALTLTNTQNAIFTSTVTAADLLTVNGDGHLFLGADGETPKIDMMYVDSASGAGWDTRIFIGRTDDLPGGAGVFPTSTITGGFGTQYQANSDGAFFGIIPYAAGNYRPVINWGDDAADSPFSFQFNGTNVVNVETNGNVGANSFTGDHKGTINTATTGVTQTAGAGGTLIATCGYADAAAAGSAVSTATSLYNLIPNGAFTTTYAFTSTAGTYAEVMESNDVITATGTYSVQMFVDDHAVGGTQYDEFYSGVMTWFATGVNDSGVGAISEIPLHRAGHAGNSGIMYLRTRETPAPDNVLKLEIMCNKTYTGASNVIFKFVRLI